MADSLAVKLETMSVNVSMPLAVDYCLCSELLAVDMGWEQSKGRWTFLTVVAKAE